jgi:hypothetical protein
MKEPTRQTCLDALVPFVAQRVRLVLAEMTASGYDPVIFETRRSQARQVWLYGIGRTHHLSQPPRTWSIHSLHLVGKAVDIYSKSHHWNWDAFFASLAATASRHGLCTIHEEGCHLEWRG